MPRIMPEPRYFSIPSSVVGGLAFRKAALNCRPWVRSLTQVPLICTHSPDTIVAACPTTVTKSRWPRTLTRNTQNPLSALWNVTRSTSPASASTGGPRSAVGGDKGAGRGSAAYGAGAVWFNPSQSRTERGSRQSAATANPLAGYHSVNVPRSWPGLRGVEQGPGPEASCLGDCMPLPFSTAELRGTTRQG